MPLNKEKKVSLSVYPPKEWLPLIESRAKSEGRPVANYLLRLIEVDLAAANLAPPPATMGTAEALESMAPPIPPQAPDTSTAAARTKARTARASKPAPRRKARKTKRK